MSYLFSVGQAIITVPDPPAHATVDVVGSDAIEVSFSPPLSDGGSPITSYTVRFKMNHLYFCSSFPFS